MHKESASDMDVARGMKCYAFVACMWYYGIKAARVSNRHR